MEGRQREARRSFDLPFEGKEEKVVIDSLLFIPPSHSLSLSSLFFLIGEKALKSDIPLSHGCVIRQVGTGRQASDKTHTHTQRVARTPTHTQPTRHLYSLMIQLGVEVESLMGNISEATQKNKKDKK